MAGGQIRTNRGTNGAKKATRMDPNCDEKQDTIVSCFSSQKKAPKSEHGPHLDAPGDPGGVQNEKKTLDFNGTRRVESESVVFFHFG